MTAVTKPTTDLGVDVTNLTQNDLANLGASLFARAYAICGDGNSDFPYDIEAELNDLGGDWMSAWDAYCAKREAAPLELAA